MDATSFESILVSVGVSHHRTPIAVRERLAPIELGETLPPAWAEGVLLATCNRVELYGVAPSAEEGLSRLRQALLARWDGPPEEISPYLDTYVGEEAARHLFRVAAGLDSLVLGEAEILGQVGAAQQAARGLVGDGLARLFQQAVQVGRRARAETAIGRNAGSVPGVAVALARRAFGTLRGRRVLVVGAGEAATLSGRALRSAGAGEVLVANRTPERALAMATRIGGKPLPWERIGEALAQVDIAITATSAADYLLRAEDLERAVSMRAAPGLLVLDLAVPRDVEPAARDLAGVSLYDIDDLQAAAGEGVHRRRREVRKVEALIEEEVGRFREWWRAIRAVPTIRALHQRAEALRERELVKALRLLPDLSPEERRVVGDLARSLMQKMLHDPVTALKDGVGDAEHIALARRLFRLPEESRPAG